MLASHRKESWIQQPSQYLSGLLYSVWYEFWPITLVRNFHLVVEEEKEKMKTSSWMCRLPEIPTGSLFADRTSCTTNTGEKVETGTYRAKIIRFSTMATCKRLMDGASICKTIAPCEACRKMGKLSEQNAIGSQLLWTSNELSNNRPSSPIWKNR